MTGYCAQSCIAAGEKPVLVTEAKDVMTIANPEKTRGYEGERVMVKGNLKQNKLTISSIDRVPSH